MLIKGREMSGQPLLGWQARSAARERGVLAGWLAILLEHSAGGERPAEPLVPLSRGCWKSARERWRGEVVADASKNQGFFAG